MTSGSPGVVSFLCAMVLLLDIPVMVIHGLIALNDSSVSNLPPVALFSRRGLFHFFF